MPRLTKIERELKVANEQASIFETSRNHWRNEAQALEKQLAAMRSRTERDFEILRNDVDGYKREVERQKQIILNLEAMIGRLCISKRIIQ